MNDKGMEILLKKKTSVDKDVEKREPWCTVRMWRKGNLGVQFMGMQIDVATMENSMVGLQKIKKELLYEPPIPLIGIYPMEFKSFYWSDICTLVFIAALFTQ